VKVFLGFVVEESYILARFDLNALSILAWFF
jgi:hypothetical protein